MKEIPKSTEINMVFNETNWLSPENLQSRPLTDIEIIKTFRTTARILHNIADETLATVEEVKSHSLYWGLVWLSNIAEKRGVVITADLPVDDLSYPEKLAHAANDPMYSWFVVELLTK